MDQVITTTMPQDEIEQGVIRSVEDLLQLAKLAQGEARHALLARAGMRLVNGFCIGLDLRLLEDRAKNLPIAQAEDRD